MPRRVQDIVPNTHRSIRDIPVERPSSVVAPIQPPARQRSGRSIPLRKPEKAVDEEKVLELPVSSDDTKPSKRGTFIPPRQRKAKSSKKWLLILMGVIIIVAAAGYMASVYFSYASFSIVPKTIPLSINSTYISKSVSEQGVLKYELAAVNGDAEATVPATDGQNVSTKAKGRITVYNSYSASSQLLIAGTRFSDDSGKIYRLTSSISVPGYTTSSQGSVVPGSITAEIAADQPGASYNITKSSSISDFKIVAYKGTPRDGKMYGRIATDISGGFVGITKTVDPKTMSSTTADLKARITASLVAQIQNTVPDGFIMYPDAYVITFSSPTIGGDDPKFAKVTMRGTMHGILFDKKELINRIVGEQAIETFDGFPYETHGLESLDFSIANAQDFSPDKKNTLIIKLKGDAVLSGSIPVDELKKKLGGLALSETGDVLRQYKPVIEIEKSSGSVTPPWSKVPTDMDRVTIDLITID